MINNNSKVVDLRIDLDRRINFAMQQNDVPVIKTLQIENYSDQPLLDLEVRISAEPSFALGWAGRIAKVGSNSVYSLDSIDLELSPGFLNELIERLKGNLSIEILKEKTDSRRISTSVELLARDEWGGLSSLPEILAAFVLPNHPGIERILKVAARYLMKWTENPSLDGYQSKDPRRVYAIVAAVYAALYKLEITYIHPPASFENEGQRVRLPDRILDSGVATCLDLALLAAGCLEQVGLNALVILVRGHAFTGVWLKEQSFSVPSMEDGVHLCKRIDLSEIAIFDPTGITVRPVLTFKQAVAEAKRRLKPEESFLCAIDVNRARKGRIRPLPERIDRPIEVQGSEDTDKEIVAEPVAPDLSDVTIDDSGQDVEEPPVDTPASRLDRWSRKLLDLTLRNRLLNYLETKKTISLLCPHLGNLEDMLASGATFRILPRPADLNDRTQETETYI